MKFKIVSIVDSAINHNPTPILVSDIVVSLFPANKLYPRNTAPTKIILAIIIVLLIYSSQLLNNITQKLGAPYIITLHSGRIVNRS